MDFLGTLLAFTIFWQISSGLQCYHCEPYCPEKFNFEEKYLKECYHSTMCFKRIATLELAGGTSQNIQRGCAAQTLDGEQKKIGKSWYPVDTIHEVYPEGCIDDPSNSERTSKTLFCYCRGDKCNSAAIAQSFTAFLIMCIVLLIR